MSVDIDVVLPALNEAASLDRSVRTLHAHLHSMGPTFRITIVDNGSTDATPDLASALADEFGEVRAMSTPQRGKGLAIALGWAASDARVLVFMDVDLSVDLSALEDLVDPLLLEVDAIEAADLCVGSRYVDGSTVTRGRKRTAVSHVYRWMIRIALGSRASDPPCGFKAIRSSSRDELLPLVRDQQWFFDTELLTLAQWRGHRVREIPVHWTEGEASKVDLTKVAISDLSGIGRMAWARIRRHR